MTSNDDLIESTWERDFVVELRLRDVDGATIGDALEQVRSHCAESGQPVRAAFGDPVAYARSLDLRGEPRGVGVTVARSVVGLVGMFLTLWGFTAWLDGDGFTLTVGRVVVIAILALAVVAISRLLDQVVRHPWWSAAAMMAAVAGLVAAEAFLTQPLAVLPALAVAAVGAVTLVATTVWELRTADATDDPVVSPVPGGATDDSRTARVLAALTPWLLPIGTAGLLVLVLVLDRLS